VQRGLPKSADKKRWEKNLIKSLNVLLDTNVANYNTAYYYLRQFCDQYEIILENNKY